MADIDITDEDLETTEDAWPEPEELTPAAAGRLLWEKQQINNAETKNKDKAKKDVARAELLVKAVPEHYELEDIKAKGLPVTFYTEEFKTFSVADKARFDAWEAEQDENYYEVKRTLRNDIFLELCRRLDDDGQPLPPGVTKYRETRLRHRARRGK